MDCNLLVGLHFSDSTNTGDLVLSGDPTPNTGNLVPSADATPNSGNLVPSDVDPETEPSAPGLSRAAVDQLLLDPAGWTSIRLGINMPARVERTERKNDTEFQLVGELTGEYHDVVMFFGIIDILQDYDITKKLEHAYKSIQYDPTSISDVDPRQYSRHFRNFILKVFEEDT